MGKKSRRKVQKRKIRKKFVVLAIFANFDCKHCQKQKVETFCHTLTVLTAAQQHSKLKIHARKATNSSPPISSFHQLMHTPGQILII
jgi:hypothetical protein